MDWKGPTGRARARALWEMVGGLGLGTKVDESRFEAAPTSMISESKEKTHRTLCVVNCSLCLLKTPFRSPLSFCFLRHQEPRALFHTRTDSRSRQTTVLARASAPPRNRSPASTFKRAGRATNTDLRSRRIIRYLALHHRWEFRHSFHALRPLASAHRC